MATDLGVCEILYQYYRYLTTNVNVKNFEAQAKTFVKVVCPGTSWLIWEVVNWSVPSKEKPRPGNALSLILNVSGMIWPTSLHIIIDVAGKSNWTQNKCLKWVEDQSPKRQDFMEVHVRLGLGEIPMMHIYQYVHNMRYRFCQMSDNNIIRICTVILATSQLRTRTILLCFPHSLRVYCAEAAAVNLFMWSATPAMGPAMVALSPRSHRQSTHRQFRESQTSSKWVSL